MMREITLRKLELLGKGVTASVYILDDQRIIKVFRDVVPMEEIQKEYDCARLVESLGIKTPSAREIVRTSDGIGIIYDRVKGITLSDMMQNNRAELFEYGMRYGQLVKSIHQKKVPRNTLKKDKETMKGLFENYEGFITDGEREELFSYIDLVPDAECLLHGDIAPVNIMVQDGEFFVIDVPTIMAGNPVFDLLQPYTFCRETTKLVESYKNMSEEEKESPIGVFLSRFKARYLDQLQSKTVWDGFLKGYFDIDPGEGTEEKDSIEFTLNFYNSVKFMGAVYMRQKFGDEVTGFLVDHGRNWLLKHKNEMNRLSFSGFYKEEI